MLSLLARLRAWWFDLPYKVFRFWQPSYRQYGEPVYEGYEIRGFSEPASVGDYVGLLQDGDTVHVYEVTEKSHGGGSDHIVSPYRYNFVYRVSLPENEFEQRQEDTGGLLPVW